MVAKVCCPARPRSEAFVTSSAVSRHECMFSLAASITLQHHPRRPQEAYTGASEDELTFVAGDIIYVPAHHDGDRLQGVFKGKARARPAAAPVTRAGGLVPHKRRVGHDGGGEGAGQGHARQGPLRLHGRVRRGAIAKSQPA